MEIMIFKTSVNKKREVSRLKNVLTIPDIFKWNFDLDDQDKILRVISDKISARQIEAVIQSAGFTCEELTD